MMAYSLVVSSRLWSLVFCYFGMGYDIISLVVRY
jgi:hypothetical protein